jgi:hypothetical protein
MLPANGGRAAPDGSPLLDGQISNTRRHGPPASNLDPAEVLLIDHCDSGHGRSCDAGGNISAMQWRRSLILVLGFAMSLSTSGCGQGARPGETGRRLLSIKWVAAKAFDDGRTVRLVYGDSSARPPVRVLVRTTSRTVGLTLQTQDPKTVISDLRLWCAQVILPIAIDGRRLIDDETVKANPYSVAHGIAGRLASDRRLPCRHIPSQPVG